MHTRALPLRQTPADLLEDLQRALTLQQRGCAPEAERVYRQILTSIPGLLQGADGELRERLNDLFAHTLIYLGAALEKAARPDEALDCYERASSALPGHAFPFTRRALLKLRRIWPAPPKPQPRSAGARITMTTLGANGRFGNQLLQYAFLRLYAETRGLAVEVPDWVGRDLFALTDALPQDDLPPLREDHFDAPGALSARAPGPVGVDLWGFFHMHGSVYVPFRHRFRDLFRFSSPARASLTRPLRILSQLRSDGAQGRDLVALHIRRGDFGKGIHWAAPTEWYLEWLVEVWPTLNRPLLYVATDDADVVADFSHFAPLSADELWTPVPGVEFLLDFAVLTEADVVAKSNSTFSAVAALLNERARLFMRPHPDLRRLVAYDPWDAPLLLAPME